MLLPSPPAPLPSPPALNPFLSELGRFLRQSRVNYWDRHESSVRLSTHRGQAEAGIWFRTAGCRYDRVGGCTMCNYSAGPDTTAQAMIEAVARAVARLPGPLAHILVSPSGSFLDDREVPKTARQGILALVGKTPTLSIETRPETVTPAALADLKAWVSGAINLYLGVETKDPWIARNAYNKPLNLDVVKRALSLIRDAGLDSTVNVLLGAPFLSPRAAVEDALATAHWALEAGASRLCLLPIHVKKATVLEALWQQGLYSPPSLWSYFDVIHRLGRTVAETRLELAWYDSYGSEAVVASPTTCPCCREECLRQLSLFAQTGSFSLIEEALALACPCRTAWREALDAPSLPREEQARRAYPRLGLAHIPTWWNKHGQNTLTDLATR